MLPAHADGGRDDLLRRDGGLQRRRALGQLGGHGGGQRAPRAVHPLSPDCRDLQDLQGLAVIEDVEGRAGAQARARLGEHVGHAVVVDAPGGVLEVGHARDLLHAGQGRRLEQVGGDHGGARQDLGAQRVVHCAGRGELLALADEHRVQDHVGEPVLLQGRIDDVDRGGGAEHADLDGVDRRVDARAGLDLVVDDLRVHRHEAVVPAGLRVHGDDAGQGRAAEDPQLVEGLEVGLGAGAAGGLRSGDGEGDGRSGPLGGVGRGCHATSVPCGSGPPPIGPPRRPRRCFQVVEIDIFVRGRR